MLFPNDQPMMRAMARFDETERERQEYQFRARVNRGSSRLMWLFWFSVGAAVYCLFS